jgi:hypothetical protein
MIFSPYEVWKHGVHHALQVSPERTGAAVFALKALKVDGVVDPLRELLAEASPLDPPPDFADRTPHEGEELRDRLFSACLVPGASDVGIGVYWTLWGAPQPPGRPLVDPSEKTASPIWAELGEPWIPFLSIGAAELIESLKWSAEPDEKVIRSELKEALQRAAPERAKDRKLIDSILTEWSEGFAREQKRFRRELEAIAKENGALFYWFDEKLHVAS